MRSDVWIPHVLCAIVGVSAWIEINGIFSELGHMQMLPEKWTLASIIVIIVQIGNIAPLIFSMIKNKPPLKWSMVLVLSMGFSSMVFLAFFWSWTYTMFGADRSLMLYIGSWIAASADCLSNLVFWPYVGQFPRSYITAMGTGESLSSAVSAAVAASQKAFGFTPSVFFIILGVTVVLSSIAFAVLESRYAPSLCELARSKSVPITQPDTEEKPSQTSTETTRPIWREHLAVLSIIAGLSFVQNGLNPSLLPIACRFYKNAYWIAQNASFVAAPMASISASFFQPRKSIWIAVFLWLACSVFTIVCSIVSEPIIVDEAAGTGVMTIVAIVSGAALAYTKVSAMLWLRSVNKAKDGTDIYDKQMMQRILTAGGVSMQIGSVAGAVTTFLLVNVAKVFASSY
jgi:riboflavin transporter 2